MKFDLTVKDATIDEVRKILDTVQNGNVSTIAEKPATPLLSPATAVAASQAATADEDDNSESTADVTGQVDKDGLPWDARIHSSNKKKKADGTWTRRRGVSDAEFETIKADLLGGGVQAPAPAAPQPAPSLPPVPAFDPAQFAQTPNGAAFAPPAQFTAPAPVAPVAPAAVPQPLPTPSVANTLNTVMTRIQQGFAAGKMDANYIPSLQQRLGQHFGVQINSITDIAGRQDLIDGAIALIDQDGK